MSFQRKMAILLSILLLFPQTSFAGSNPPKKGGDIHPFSYIEFPKEGDGKPYSKHKAPMTVEDRINQYTISIAGLMGEDLAAMNSDILLDGEYNMDFLGEDSGTMMFSNFDEGSTFNFGSIQEQVYFFLRKQGFSAASAAGIMGNIEQESGFNPALEEKTKRKEKGYGLMQWTFGRRTSLESYCGSDIKNPVKQMEYFLTEFNNSYEQYRIGIELSKIGVLGAGRKTLKGALAIEAYKKLTDPIQAAEVFCWGFERPNKLYANMGRRRGAARKYYDQFSNLSISELEEKGNLFTRNQKNRPEKKDYDIAIYEKTKSGDGLKTDEAELASESLGKISSSVSVPGEPPSEVVFSHTPGPSTRIELLQRIERMKGAKFDKIKLRNTAGHYDAPSFVDRTTAFMTRKTTMGQELKPNTDIYEDTNPGPFKTHGRAWYQSRYNVKKPKIANPKPQIIRDKNGDEKLVFSVRFVEIERSELKPGDLCFVVNKEKSHMAFYMGGGRVFGAINEALGVNWIPYRGGSTLDYYNRFYRTLHLKTMDEDQYKETKKEQKKVLATKRDAFTGRDDRNAEELDRPLDDLGKPLYNYKWGDKGNPEDI